MTVIPLDQRHVLPLQWKHTVAAMLTPDAGCEPEIHPGASVAQEYVGGADSGICEPASPVKRYQPLSELSHETEVSSVSMLRLAALNVEYVEHSEKSSASVA